MQPVAVQCRAQLGLDSPPVSVEVDLGPGLPGLTIIGLAETAVKESRDRVKAALLNSGFDMPDRRIVVNLAPADLPKTGGRFDLPIAIGILCASQQLPDALLNQCELYGELALNGELRGIGGALPAALRAAELGRRAVFPAANEHEAGLLCDERILVADNLTSVAQFLAGNAGLRGAAAPAAANAAIAADLAEVVGQTRARRGLEIAAAGGHHLLLSGPPGTGKSMLARRLPGLLPALQGQQALETAALYSLRGLPASEWPAWGAAPFRDPHHTASAAALAGGGGSPRPGELSLAHHGVLFMDELPEFRRSVLEVLREPLEHGQITIARARQTIRFPARFQLVAAMNPCPCGYYGDPTRECRCTSDQVSRYRQRISGPFLDRLDLHIELPREHQALTATPAPAESSGAVAARAWSARTRALERCGRSNAELHGTALHEHAWPDRRGLMLLNNALSRFAMSRRACDRALRVARTIADLDGAAAVGADHIAEALSFRQASA